MASGLDGVVENLGAVRVADIGCGHGISTILMAKARGLHVLGSDNHE
jgi:2-polyprenyl-3-methyl-5-hydroxy-6-metoxy-1,4-benzoquinol methylase